MQEPLSGPRETPFLRDGQDENLSVWQKDFQSSGTLDAGHFWQVDVHQDNIGTAGRELAKGFFSCRARADAFEVATVADEAPPALTHVFDVLDEANADEGFAGTIDWQRG